jgi:hypothetical protein
VDACSTLSLPSGLILTYAQEEEREANGLRIFVSPVWKWLLAIDIPQASYDRNTSKRGEQK